MMAISSSTRLKYFCPVFGITYVDKFKMAGADKERIVFSNGGSEHVIVLVLGLVVENQIAQDEMLRRRAAPVTLESV